MEKNWALSKENQLLKIRIKELEEQLKKVTEERDRYDEELVSVSADSWY